MEIGCSERVEHPKLDSVMIDNHYFVKSVPANDSNDNISIDVDSSIHY